MPPKTNSSVFLKLAKDLIRVKKEPVDNDEELGIAPPLAALPRYADPDLEAIDTEIKVKEEEKFQTLLISDAEIEAWAKLSLPSAIKTKNEQKQQQQQQIINQDDEDFFGAFPPPLIPDQTLDEEAKTNITRFRPHIPKRSTPAERRHRIANYQTKTGKFLAQTDATTLYGANTTPGWAILQNFKSTSMTDDDGRLYFLAHTVDKNDFGWEKLRQLETSLSFDRKADAVFFVRLPPGAKDLSVAAFLPPIEMTKPRLFAVKVPVVDPVTGKTSEIIEKWQGYIKDHGADELEKSANRGDLGRIRGRRTSYVIIHNLHPVV